MTVVALVGAQFGSEAKGAIAAHIASEFGVHIRTGAPNAGHTLYHEGVKHVMRSVPCGFVNRDAMLVIGPGALIDLELLTEEVQALQDAGFNVRERLLVDRTAGLIDPTWHHALEGGIDGQAHRLIGSTGEGVGPARMAKISRGTWDEEWANFELAKHHPDSFAAIGTLCDTAAVVNDQIDKGVSVLLEGAQGSGLSLVHGPWPYCTSADTNAGQLCVDAGISPSMLDRTILVARTFPIRVAGNSGPLYGETTWEAVGVEEERTTVTKKVRRVGTWDVDQIRRAVMLNRPAVLAITFLNYLDGDVWEKTKLTSLSPEVVDWLTAVEVVTGVDVAYCGTSPWTVFELPGAKPRFGT